MATRRTSRTVRAALPLLAAAVAVALVPGSSSADPGRTVAEVQRQVDALHHKAEQASERYNDARLELAEIERDLERVRERVERQQARVDALREGMGRLAAAAYRSGGVDPTLELLLSGDPGAFLRQASSLDQVSRSQDSALRRMTQARQRLAQDRIVLVQQVARQQQVRQRLAREKAEIEVNADRAEALLRTLKAAERRRLAAAADARQAAAARASRSGTRGAPGVSAPDYTGPAAGRAAAAVAFAQAQVGDAYSYGAAGPDAWDCSGLTMMSWNAAGVSLPHSSSAQYSSGTPVSQSALQPGDLVFFYSPISHVGIYVGGGMIIHASNPSRPVGYASISSMPYSGAVRP